MRANRCLPALALLLFLPARADESAVSKAPAPADGKKTGEQMSCCAGEEKAKCPRAKAAASSKKPATKTAPAAATAKPGAAGAANMVVTRDPETGELRNATAAEREKLLGRRPLATPEHKVITLPDGSVMVELGEADMSYAVATRSADGTISQTCVHGDAEARKAASTPAPAPAKPADR
jgi:hypothetical protein